MRPETTRPRWALSLAKAYVLLFFALIAAAVFLGVPSRHGTHATPLPGAVALLAPAGGLLIVPGAVAFARPSLGLMRRPAALVVLILGIGLLGVGLASLTGHPEWRALALPAIVMTGVWIGREQLRGPKRSVFSRATGSGRHWPAYLTVWVLLLLFPAFALWSLGVW